MLPMTRCADSVSSLTPITETRALSLRRAIMLLPIGGIESVERGQFEAARSLGLTRQQTLRHVVLPQAFKRMIPPLTSELIALTKETSLLWVIGVFEVTAAAKGAGAHTYAYLEAFLVAAGMYLLVTIPLSFLARNLERRLGYEATMGVHL